MSGRCNPQNRENTIAVQLLCEPKMHPAKDRTFFFAAQGPEITPVHLGPRTRRLHPETDTRIRPPLAANPVPDTGPLPTPPWSRRCPNHRSPNSYTSPEQDTARDRLHGFPGVEGATNAKADRNPREIYSKKLPSPHRSQDTRTLRLRNRRCPPRRGQGEEAQEDAGATPPGQT